MNISLRRWSRLGPGLVAASVLAACGSDEAPPPPKTEEAPPPKKEAPPIDAATKQKMDDDLATSRQEVEKARALKQEGLELERSKGNGAGRAKFSEAATLYKGAINRVSIWIEPTAAEVDLSTEQRAWYVPPLMSDRQTWLEEAATLGPLMTR